MRTIGVVTVARSDYGIYLPILRQLQADPCLKLHLLVSGMHLSPEFGLTVKVIEADGFEVCDRIEMLLSSDTPAGVAQSMGLGIIGFAQSYARFKPDLLLVLGDRFEMLAAVTAALPFKIPVAHIHGGESTEGLIDEAIRHSITKMSHLHFASTNAYAQRIIRMGEAPWRVTVSGAPGLDNLHQIPLLSAQTLEQQCALNFQEPFLLVTFHPVTLEYEQTEAQLQELLAALEQSGFWIIFTYPNADTQGRRIIEAIQQFSMRYPRAQIATNLGSQRYFSVMNCAIAMVGNSSSGIIEAASFKLPVVNIGNRQRGRIHSNNVIDVGCTTHEILNGIKTATSAAFRESLAELTNPYGEGRAATKIVTVLKQTQLNNELLLKRFYDGEG